MGMQAILQIKPELIQVDPENDDLQNDESKILNMFLSICFIAILEKFWNNLISMILILIE